MEDYIGLQWKVTLNLKIIILCYGRLGNSRQFFYHKNQENMKPGE